MGQSMPLPAPEWKKDVEHKDKGYQPTSSFTGLYDSPDGKNCLIKTVKTAQAATVVGTG